MKGLVVATFLIVTVALIGCSRTEDYTEPTRNEHQHVTTETRETVRETSLEWRQRMSEKFPEPGF